MHSVQLCLTNKYPISRFIFSVPTLLIKGAISSPRLIQRAKLPHNTYGSGIDYDWRIVNATLIDVIGVDYPRFKYICSRLYFDSCMLVCLVAR